MKSLLLVFLLTQLLTKEVKKYTDVTHFISVIQFEKLKTIILKKGDRRSYSANYIANPHYTLNEFDLYLNAELGQNNRNNDPTVSDFNELVIIDNNASIKIYVVHIVRQGDINKANVKVYEGMKENHIYLMNTSKYDVDDVKTIFFKPYVIKIKKTLIPNN